MDDKLVDPAIDARRFIIASSVFSHTTVTGLAIIVAGFKSVRLNADPVTVVNGTASALS